MSKTNTGAVEHAKAYAELEQRLKEKTAELDAVTKELDSFARAVSHDLRGPLGNVKIFTQLLRAKHGKALDEKGLQFLGHIATSADQTMQLIEDLLALAKVSQTPVKRERVDLTKLALDIVAELRIADAASRAEVMVAEGLSAEADGGLLRIALANLLANAWKFSSKRETPRIEVGAHVAGDGKPAWFVRDNGTGFDMKYVDKLFTPFQRLHRYEEYPGTGIGLATVHRIVSKHGGRIWTEAAPGQGATFFFTL